MTDEIMDHLKEKVSKADLNLLQSPRAPLMVKDFGDRGRGIVAVEDIEQGRLIERSPVLIIPSEQRRAIDNTVAGEELTIDYQMTLWFDPVRID